MRSIGTHEYGQVEDGVGRIRIEAFVSGQDIFLEVWRVQVDAYRRGDFYDMRNWKEWGTIRLTGAHTEMKCEQAVAVEAALKQAYDGLEPFAAVKRAEERLAALTQEIREAEDKLGAMKNAKTFAGEKKDEPPF
jgi:hypothetical protein